MKGKYGIIVNMKKMNSILKTTILIMATSILLSGCTSSKIEKQDQLKEAAINSIGAGDYQTALNNLNEALSFANGYVTEREVDICFYKGAVQYLLGDTAGALETYSALIDYNNEDPYAYYMRGNLYLKEKETELALSDYKTATKISDKDYELYIQIYENLDASGLRDNGLEFLNMALEIEGNSASQLQWRGRIYMILDQYEAAIRVLSSSVEKGNNEANIYLAQAYKESGEIEKSKEILSAFAQQSNTTASGMLVLGDLYMEDGSYDQAYETYEAALALEDDTYHKQILKNEIGALEYAGRYQEALDKANAYILEYPADTDVLREIVFLETRV